MSNTAIGKQERISTVEFNRRVAAGQLVQDAQGKWREADAKTGKPKATSKYGNKITEVDGRKFDSALEAQHYQLLKQQKEGGVIADFECQVRYPIADKVLNEDGSVYSHKIDYVADFAITHLDGRIELVDVKGMVLGLYKLKKALMWHRHQIKITEIFSSHHKKAKKAGKRPITGDTKHG